MLDRNFPGVARISRLIKVTHVLIRLKCDIPVRRIGPFLPDGSYLADVCGGGQSVRMRVIEYHVTVEGQDVPEMFCLVTDLEDWRAHPAAVLAGAYKWRFLSALAVSRGFGVSREQPCVRCRNVAACAGVVSHQPAIWWIDCDGSHLWSRRGRS